MSPEDHSKSDEHYSDLITKLNCIVMDQERVVKQLDQMSKQMHEIKRFDEAIERTLKTVHTSQTTAEERFDQLSHMMTKVENEQNRVMLMQNDFRIELTNKAYMQNEIIKELSVLSKFVQSNQLHSTLIRQRLKETEREVAMIGFSQNRFADNLSDFKDILKGTLNDLKLSVEAPNCKKALSTSAKQIKSIPIPIACAVSTSSESPPFLVPDTQKDNHKDDLKDYQKNNQTNHQKLDQKEDQKVDRKMDRKMDPRDDPKDDLKDDLKDNHEK
jgi:hypothetical protein